MNDLIMKGFLNGNNIEKWCGDEFFGFVGVVYILGYLIDVEI